MKVTVTKYLNVRMGKPSVNAPCRSFMVPGTVLEVDGQLYEGDRVEGINTWMKDEAGNFYWSGGINFQNSSAKEVIGGIPAGSVGWGIKILNMPEVWKVSRGEEMRIAVLDTGVIMLPDLEGVVETGFNVITNDSNYRDEDGHGKRCALIIAAQGKQLTGVAPDAKLLICKIMNDSSFVVEENLIKGIDWAMQVGADIISMSLALGNGSDRLHKKIIEAFHKGILLVAAVGNEGQLNFEVDNCPACYDECLSVGSISSNSQRSSMSSKSKNLDCLAPGEDIYSEFIEKKDVPDSSSMATAFASGTIALLKAFTKKNSLVIDNATLLKIIQETTIDYGVPGFDVESGYGILNPLGAINRLKELK